MPQDDTFKDYLAKRQTASNISSEEQSCASMLWEISFSIDEILCQEAEFAEYLCFRKSLDFNNI